MSFSRSNTKEREESGAVDECLDDLNIDFRVVLVPVPRTEAVDPL